VFKSHNPIKKFSNGIIEDICSDIPGEIGLLVSSGYSWTNGHYPYGIIVDDLNLYGHDNLLHVINLYYDQLKDGGILVMNILGGQSLYQLADAMLQSDLIENRFVTRMLPTVLPEILLSIGIKSQFRYVTTMSNTTTMNYGSVSEVIQSLREIKLTKKMSNTQPTSKKYWQSVEEIFSKLHNCKVTIEVITLLAVKE
jgi:hypothetical protein